jgi:alkaline phosphatase
MRRLLALPVFVFCLSAVFALPIAAGDRLRELQTEAIESGKSPAAHWGPDPDNYTAWGTHSLRLIPVYTFGTRGAGSGVDLDSYTGTHSAYRNEAAVRSIYSDRLPTNTVNPAADYMDQTQVAALQRAGFARGKKHIFLVVFDGMDWQTTRAAAIYNKRAVAYSEGRGTGTHFQDYTAGNTSQFAYMVTASYDEGTKVDVDKQLVLSPGKLPGGYNAEKGGPNPWTPGSDPIYLTGKKDAALKADGEHAYPDSSATATAMCSGVKTFNDSVNVDIRGDKVSTVALEMQAAGFAVGVVTSVPITHATPACAYAHNVSRDDFQDLTRDMLGLRSVSHPERPLPGVDVLIGGGFGDIRDKDKGQGENFVPGNAWITDDDLKSIDAVQGGSYFVAMRTPGVNGRDLLANQAAAAAASGKRLFGMFGVAAVKGHLPYQTADGDYHPTVGRSKKAEQYTPADINENPRLQDFARAALTVLEKNKKGFWLMVEAGEVDWANHDNNLDNAIGAVN